MIKKSYFLDADYIIKDGRTYVRLLLKGKKITRRYYQYNPYFYTAAPIEKKAEIECISGRNKKGETVTPLKVEVVTKSVSGKEKKLLKVYCEKPTDVPVIKELITGYSCYEYKIPFGKRFAMDFSIAPFSVLEYELEGKMIKRIISVSESSKIPDLSMFAFDIETYNPAGAPRDKKDPIVMISWYGKKNCEVLTYKNCQKNFVRIVNDENEMLEKFSEILQEENPDIILGYNSGAFDLPYMQTRAQLLKARFRISRSKKINGLNRIKKGLIQGVKIDGRVHIDLYPISRFFGFVGLIKAQDYTLGKVSEAIFKKGKFVIQKSDIWKLWDAGDIERLVEYSLRDAQLTKELGEYYLPLLIELSKVSRASLFDTSLSTSGQLVESLLMAEAVRGNFAIPSKPSDPIIKERIMAPIQGAFVKLPEPGIYDNIAVLDFRGMYPSIIVSYNIDPFTLTKEESDVHLSPTGARFSKKEKCLIPHVVENLIEQREKIKDQLKKCKKESEEWRYLFARSNALKILTNSHYGYLGYARSRWYSRECAESVTAWGRKHITETMEKAEKAGFTVVYGDTDSLIVLYKNKDDVFKFLEMINEKLPGKMELELEGFYSRGVFVSKKAEEKGAKKKYALIGEDGRIKIRGFELVRRDWSEIAKKTQYSILEVILKEGNIDKAVRIVRDVIQQIRSGGVAMEELAIETQLNKDPTRYEIKSPELAAASKGKERGMAFEKGSVISYVITKNGRSISEKADLAEFAKDYDADYYINNQILPAVLKILKGLGYDKDALKIGGKQKGLDAFF